MIIRRPLHFVALFLAFALISLAQMTPSAPVKKFSLPRFSEDGFIEWMLRGDSGVYDGPEQVRVEGMSLRIYSGDERLAVEMSLASPSAIIRLEENSAFSNEAIEIEGSDFKITGIGWEWIGETKEIIVKSETKVEFVQAISGGFNQSYASASEGKTMITSQQLVLQTTTTEYHFEFNGRVRAESAGWVLDSNLLEVVAEPPKGRDKAPSISSSSEIDSIRTVTAIEDVVFRQGVQTVRCGKAMFLPNEERAILTERPSIEAAGAYLTGDRVETEGGEVVIAGSEEGERAQMILTDTGGLGIEGAAALSSETVLLANSIILRGEESGHCFNFDGQVEAFSGEVKLTADHMKVLATESNGSISRASESIQVRKIEYLYSKGNVRVDRSEQIATSEEMIFYPEESRAVLTGEPQIKNDSASVRGFIMELQPDMVIIRGLPDEPLEVELPELPNFGYEIAKDKLDEEVEMLPEDDAGQSTLVRSQLLNMIEEDGKTVFRFSGGVEVEATNLLATCERLDAVSIAQIGPEEPLSDNLELEQIEAFESVRIEQGDRVAESIRARILPGEGKLVLEEEAIVEDSRGKVEGQRITINRGQRRVVVEGGGKPGERAKITLPGLIEGKF